NQNYENTQEKENFVVDSSYESEFENIDSSQNTNFNNNYYSNSNINQTPNQYQTAPQNNEYNQTEWNSEGEIVTPPQMQGGYSQYATYPPYNTQNNGPYYNQNKKKKKPKNKSPKKGSFIALAVSLCVVASTVFSFGGTYLANFINNNKNGTSATTDTRIIYQSVANKDENGSDITTPLTTEQVVAAAADSVVEITTESLSTGSFFQQAVQKGAGSGVIITSDGYIMTNNHVIEGANKVTVRTRDGKTFEAKLIGTDDTTDIAIIKVEASELKAAVLGKSSGASVGQTAIAIGNPLGQLGGTVTQGIISALDRTIVVENKTMTLLQIDAAINPGNSGGGLFNSYGELIGIVNAGYTGSEVDGLGFAVPIDIAKPVMENLMTYGYVKGRPYLGVSLIEINDAQTAMVYRVSEYGLYIMKVNDGSAAAQAGLKQGDRIVSINGTSVSTTAEFSAQLDKFQSGQSVELVIKSGLTENKVKVTLTEKTNVTDTSN
ncbi:MAG: trypsin-like peptidase domain-containing protein, partial [Oscillospiraceae bacterium]